MTGPCALSAQGLVSHLQQERQDHAPPKGAVLLYSIPAMEQDPHPGEDTAPALALHQGPALGHGATESSSLPRLATSPAADPSGAPSPPQNMGRATDGAPLPTSLLRAVVLGQAPTRPGGPETFPDPHPQTTARARARSPGSPEECPRTGDRPKTTEAHSQDATLGDPLGPGALVYTQRSLEVRTLIGASGREPGPYIVRHNASRLATQHALKGLLATMAD